LIPPPVELLEGVMVAVATDVHVDKNSSRQVNCRIGCCDRARILPTTMSCVCLELGTLVRIAHGLEAGIGGF
jgi:hypothetical protein